MQTLDRISFPEIIPGKPDRAERQHERNTGTVEVQNKFSLFKAGLRIRIWGSALI
jgi:hypothetical protein